MPRFSSVKAAELGLEISLSQNPYSFHYTALAFLPLSNNSTLFLKSHNGIVGGFGGKQKGAV